MPGAGGLCLHTIVLDPRDRNRMYVAISAAGVYRSDDGGKSWVSIEAGLPSTFGFPIVTHPHDPDTAFTIPLNGDDRGRFMPDGRAAVWRTADAGATWTDLRAGLPQQDAYLGVLREAMAVDRLDPFGIYFGTSTGQVFASADEGRTWREIASFLPPDLGPARYRAGDSHPRQWLRRKQMFDDATALSVACARAQDCWLATGARCAPRRSVTSARSSTSSRRCRARRRCPTLARWPSWSPPSTPAGRGYAIGCVTRVRPCASTSTCSWTGSAPACRRRYGLTRW